MFVRNGVAVIRYALQPGQTSYDLYKKFGMDEQAFISLNSDTTASLNENEIYLAISNILLAQCNSGECVRLIYSAAAGDNFKNVGAYLGNLNPYVIKQLNPKVEAVSPGRKLLVGFLPNHILDAGNTGKSNPTAKSTISNSDSAATTAAKTPSKTSSSDTTVTKQPDTPYMGAGYFTSEYAPVKNTKTPGKATNFKSLGGWYDGKFYVLVNGIQTGRLVKITNTQNGKYIVAKVAGALPSLKTDKHLLARISNAGCAALDIWDESEFDIELEE